MTKEQWLEMWQAIRKIEDAAKLIAPVKGGPRYDIIVETAHIKRMIQNEVGQLE